MMLMIDYGFKHPSDTPIFVCKHICMSRFIYLSSYLGTYAMYHLFPLQEGDARRIDLSSFIIASFCG